MLFSSMHVHIYRDVPTNTTFSAVKILHTAFRNPRHSVACRILCKRTQVGSIHNSCSSASTHTLNNSLHVVYSFPFYPALPMFFSSITLVLPYVPFIYI